MPSTDRRARERAALQEKILAAARALFVAEGYEAVSLRRIAEAIEYTPPAIYTHFKDKSELMRELCRRDFGSLTEEMIKLARIDDPLRRVARYGLAYIRFGVEHPQHYRLMFMTPHPPDLEPDEKDLAQMNDPDSDGYAALRHALAEAVASGRIREEYADVELLAQIFWAAVHGVVSLQITHEHDPWITWRPLMKRARAMIGVTLRGVMTSEAAEEFKL